MLAFRPTFMMSLPTILADLGLSHEDGGVILSTCQVSYMISKPVAQVISDSVDGRTLMLWSIVSTALCCSLVPLAVHRWHLQVLLFLVMVCQAPHAPACLRMISNWYGPKERGAAYSSINAAVNVVSCVVPAMVNSILLASSWHALYLGIGLLTGAMALMEYPIILDSPSKANAAWKDIAPIVHSKTSSIGDGKHSGARLVLGMGSVWAVGLLFAALYGMRFGIEGWVGTFLRESAGPAAQEAAARTTATFLFWWQAGGFVGSSLAGPAADHWGGRTLPLAAGCAALLSGATGLMHTMDHGDLLTTWKLPLVAALSGACVYAQRLLFNLFTRTQVHSSVAGTADALVSCLGEMGGAMAGFPLIRLVTYAETWRAYTAALLALSVALSAGNAALTLGCGGAAAGSAAVSTTAPPPEKDAKKVQ